MPSPDTKQKELLDLLKTNKIAVMDVLQKHYTKQHKLHLTPRPWSSTAKMMRAEKQNLYKRAFDYLANQDTYSTKTDAVNAIKALDTAINNRQQGLKSTLLKDLAPAVGLTQALLQKMTADAKDEIDSAEKTKGAEAGSKSDAERGLTNERIEGGILKNSGTKSTEKKNVRFQEQVDTKTCDDKEEQAAESEEETPRGPVP